MRKAAALEFIIKIRVRVKLDDGQIWVACADSSQYRIRHRVVTTQANWAMAFVQKCSHCSFDQLKGTDVFWKLQVSRVGESTRLAQVYPGLAPRI